MGTVKFFPLKYYPDSKELLRLEDIQFEISATIHMLRAEYKSDYDFYVAKQKIHDKMRSYIEVCTPVE